MEQPNPYLDGESPIELAETVEGANRVLEYIRNWIAQSTQPAAPDVGVSSAIDE
ncbi:6-hydroxy-3-succinoylpyridine 3-monooxygenase HspA [compost metagenome]